MFRVYTVWPTCPSVSISGSACRLNCWHCGGRYLKYMRPVTSPSGLLRFAKNRMREGVMGDGRPEGRGILISGGCERNGEIMNLRTFLPAIRQIHEMGYIVKLHTGLVDEHLAAEIAAHGVDIASFEVIGSESVLERIFRLKIGLSQYMRSVEDLFDSQIPVVAPHICIGLGRPDHAERAIDLLEPFQPHVLTLITFIPTRGTPLSHSPIPSPMDVRRIMRQARKTFPESHIVLGALRPRGASYESSTPAGYRESLEISAVNEGLDGIELPSKALLRHLHGSGDVRHIRAFGVLPPEWEEKFIERGGIVRSVIR